MIDYYYLDLHTCYVFAQTWADAIVCDGDTLKATVEKDED